jgi:hypothetical protein
MTSLTKLLPLAILRPSQSYLDQVLDSIALLWAAHFILANGTTHNHPGSFTCSFHCSLKSLPSHIIPVDVNTMRTELMQGFFSAGGLIVECSIKPQVLQERHLGRGEKVGGVRRSTERGTQIRNKRGREIRQRGG